MKKMLFLSFCVFLINRQSAGQNEFFVSVNPADGSFTKLGSFREVNWIRPMINTYSQALHRFYFCGTADLKSWKFYTIDAYTGAIISALPFPENDPDLLNLSGIVYNDADDRMYAQYWNSTDKTCRIVAVDPQNLSYHTVLPIPGLMARGMYATIDKKNNRYICSGVDTAQISWSYVTDITTGSIVSAQHVPVSMDYLRYDNDRELLYGMGYKVNGFAQAVLSFDPMTGIYAIVRPMTDMRGNYGIGGVFTYDELNKNYYYAAIGGNNEPCFVTVNTTSGELQNTPPPFPHINGGGDNIICWQYDNAMDKLLALHWEPMPKGRKVRIYPDPFNYTTTVYLDTFYTSATSVLFSVDGKKVQQDDVYNSNKIHLNRNNLASGEYYIRVYTNGSLLGVEKIVIN